LQKIKDLLSHSMPEAGFAEVIAHLAKSYLDREGRRQGKGRQQGKERRISESRRSNNDNAEPSRRSFAAALSRSSFAAALSRSGGKRNNHGGEDKARLTPRQRKQILARDVCCTYKDPKTGKICGSTYQLEVDHIYPTALGGSHRKNNLRTLCRKHNLLMAEKTLGPWVRRYRTRSATTDTH
jgi:hypothetical protein